MKTIFTLLQSLGNLNASLTFKDGKGILSVRPITDGIKDQAVSHVRDLTIQFDENDTEESIIEIISNYIPEAIEKVNSIRTFELGLAKAEAEKKEAKEREEKAKKLIDKLNQAFDPNTEKKESEHTKLFNEFKEEFRDHKDFSKLEKMFNDKYVSLDLFNQNA